MQFSGAPWTCFFSPRLCCSSHETSKNTRESWKDAKYPRVIRSRGISNTQYPVLVKLLPGRNSPQEKLAFTVVTVIRQSIDTAKYHCFRINFRVLQFSVERWKREPLKWKCLSKTGANNGDVILDIHPFAEHITRHWLLYESTISSIRTYGRFYLPRARFSVCASWFMNHMPKLYNNNNPCRGGKGNRFSTSYTNT